VVARAGAVDSVGSMLRRVRQQLGLALADLPGLTGGQFAAAAVGSYEREFRSPSVERLAALCGYYGVPLVEVLAGHSAPAGHGAYQPWQRPTRRAQRRRSGRLGGSPRR